MSLWHSDTRIPLPDGREIPIFSMSPRSYVHHAIVLIIIHCLNDGFCYQSWHIVKILHGIVGLSDKIALTVEHAEACIRLISLKVVYAWVDNQLRISHSLRKRTWFACKWSERYDFAAKISKLFEYSYFFITFLFSIKYFFYFCH